MFCFCPVKRTTNTKQLEFMKQDNFNYRRENENENLKDEVDQGRTFVGKRQDVEKDVDIKETTAPPTKKTKTTNKTKVRSRIIFNDTLGTLICFVDMLRAK